jgi:hypothetical protein
MIRLNGVEANMQTGKNRIYVDAKFSQTTGVAAKG